MTVSARPLHESLLAGAFDRQAAAFERAPIQTDPRLLSGLVGFAGLPVGATVLDAGCGPGLVAEALLLDPRGYRVLGCDLSGKMIARARARCSRFGARAELVQAALADVAEEIASGRRPPVDAAVTRLVLHHVPDPRAFVALMASCVRPGGIVVLADHLADPDPELAEWHRSVEVMRDCSHVANLSGGGLLDAAALAGLVDLRYEERAIATEFDEWFDRGTPCAAKEECRALLLAPEGRGSRAWRARELPDGGIRLEGVVGLVRGARP